MEAGGVTQVPSDGAPPVPEGIAFGKGLRVFFRGALGGSYKSCLLRGAGLASSLFAPGLTMSSLSPPLLLSSTMGISSKHAFCSLDLEPRKL